MNCHQLSKIMEGYGQKSEAMYGDIRVIRVSDQKTVFVEQMDGVGWAITMDRHEVDGATYWAGYSSRSETVYLSLAA